MPKPTILHNSNPLLLPYPINLTIVKLTIVMVLIVTSIGQNSLQNIVTLICVMLYNGMKANVAFHLSGDVDKK